MKKQSNIIAVIAVMILTAFGCQKVEEIPLAQNEILPLAVGNTWVYSDIIITSTPSSIDTVSTQVTFKVIEKIYLDRVVKENGKERLERIHGWKVNSDNDDQRNFGLFVIGDKIYGSSEYTYFRNGEPDFLPTFNACHGILATLSETPEFISTNTVVIAPVIQYPIDAGKPLQTFPAFHNFGSCLYPVEYTPEGPPVNFPVYFEPLIATSTPVVISTLAGTFNCIDYGSQYWSNGIGMIESHNITNGNYRNADGNVVDCTIDWKRTLVSYTIE